MSLKTPEESTWTFILFLCLLTGLTSLSQAQPASEEEREVYLSFRYQAALDDIVVAYYKDDQFYLPFAELFKILEIDYEVNLQNLSVNGIYVDEGEEYSVNFKNQQARRGDERFTFSAEQYLIKELDFYITPALFNKIFDLSFVVNFNALDLQLEAPYTMPVVARYQRQQRREQLEQLYYDHTGYPLKFDRNRQLLDGGFLDYSLSSNISEGTNIYTYSTNLGAELLGGDLQGSIFGSYSDEVSTFRTDNLRLRYVMDDNPYLRQVLAGQVITEGLNSNSIVGVRLTNQPVIPRTLFDQYAIDGNTIPQSEVEVYLNNALVGFEEADELGNYRFTVPLTYGNSRLNLKIYGPSGQVQEIARRIDIPFTFTPPGQTYYSVSAGRLDNPFAGIQEQNFVAQSRISSGLTDWLTGTVGAEYYKGYNNSLPTFYGSVASRILTNYIVSVDAVPQAFYRFSSNVVYPSAASWNIGYTYYTADQGIYNLSNLNQEISANAFFPIMLGKFPINFRILGTREFRDFGNLTRYRLDLNTRLSRLNLRLAYRDTKIGTFNFTPGNLSQLSASATYMVSRKSSLPSYLAGTFFRATANYSPTLSQVEQIELNLTKNISQDSNIRLNFARNFIGDFNLFGINLIFDFNKIRTNSTFQRAGNRNTFTNTLRGSIGYDSYNNKLKAINRQQVGRSGAAFRLFVDSNSSGSYEEGEQIIQEDAIRLNRSGGAFIYDDDLTYLTQLRSYDRYNIEINKGVIRNPLLVPATEKFSFIADPNRYKPIEIPFFMSGVIEGSVKMKNRNQQRALAGVTVNLRQMDGDFNKTMRTFSDGTFYTYEVPPGQYTVKIDSSQLAFLNARSKPEQIEFEVETAEDGDYINDLNFILTPLGQTNTVTNDTTTVNQNTAEEPKETTSYSHQIIAGNYTSIYRAMRAKEKAEEQFALAFAVTWSKNQNMYVLISEPMKSGREIATLLKNKPDDEFSDATLISRPSTEIGFQATAYTVQLGAFSSEANALAFKQQSASVIPYPLQIARDSRFQNLYKVKTTAFYSFNEALKAQRAIKKNAQFDEAFITGQPVFPYSDTELDYQLKASFGETLPTASHIQSLVDSMVPSMNRIDIRWEGNDLIIGGIKNEKEALLLVQKLQTLENVQLPIVIRAMRASE